MEATSASRLPNAALMLIVSLTTNSKAQMNHAKQARLPHWYRFLAGVPLSACVVALGMGLYDWWTGAPEWRPGSTVDHILVSGAALATLAGLFVFFALLNSPTSPVKRARDGAALALIVLGGVLLAMRILRM